ncbi:DUF4231 domain-containing protein [Crocosphaera sp.]|uniref:DUF4231 domain-containing protein n=1 Tax=Crocosphaera sp. TaxID=2729996 RepID=UPI0026396EC4|nr:DUF4231 domain-containing protein [Crocosphaera sp.]MDJ0581199.1 DUF4231 domain-containing protein [Crocosphaera sp.]
MNLSESSLPNNPEEKPSSLVGLRRFLKVLEYIFLDAFAATVIITFVAKNKQLFITLDAVFLAGFTFLLLFNSQYFSAKDRAERESKYEELLGSSQLSDNRLQLERENALRYCQQLVEDYSSTRKNSRNFYYILQISTIIFSGVTPVLVLVDKLDTGPEWLNWLPVILPAFASIFASFATSFPLENRWKEANKVVENLEAEQEKFILKITKLDMKSIKTGENIEKKEKSKEEKQAIEKQAIAAFINRVNDIHLNQVQSEVEDINQPELDTATRGEET